MIAGSLESPRDAFQECPANAVEVAKERAAAGREARHQVVDRTVGGVELVDQRSVGGRQVLLTAFTQQPAAIDTSDFVVYSSRQAFSIGRIDGPNAPLALGQNDQYRNQFGSWHPGVVPMLFGDGSTQLLRNAMSTTVLCYLCGSQEGASPGDYQ
jgi:hypothetical protein